MSQTLSNGYFSLMGDEKHDLDSFSKIIVSWSLDSMKRSFSDAKQCGLVSIMSSRNLPSLPFTTCVVSFHASIYLVMVIEFSDFPIEHFEVLRNAIVLEILTIKNDRNEPVYSENEGKLMDYLIQKYAKQIAESLNNDSKTISYGPGGSVLDTIRQLYDLEVSDLNLETNMKFPLLLNASISSVYEALIQEGRCKWEVAHEKGSVRSRQQILREFGISAEELDTLYESYSFSLKLRGATKDWNEDVDDITRSTNALSSQEIELGKIILDRAILNRIILRLSMESKSKVSE